MNKSAHMVAGAGLGLICYAGYLFCLFGSWPRRVTIMGTSNVMGMWPQYRVSRLLVWSQWQWPELVAVALGLVLPVGFACLGLWCAQHRPIALLQSRFVPLLIGGLGLLAVLLVVFLIRRMVRYPLP